MRGVIYLERERESPLYFIPLTGGVEYRLSLFHRKGAKRERIINVSFPFRVRETTKLFDVLSPYVESQRAPIIDNDDDNKVDKPDQQPLEEDDKEYEEAKANEEEEVEEPQTVVEEEDDFVWYRAAGPSGIRVLLKAEHEKERGDEDKEMIRR